MDTRSYKIALEAINKEIDSIHNIAENANVPETILNQIIELKESSLSDDFKVLVIGEFSSGKSTMVNALLGEPILPERATTATAIITEIRYGKQKKAVIYPKENAQGVCDPPFEVSIADLRKYLLIGKNLDLELDDKANTVEGNVIESPYKKMEIYWPLKILEDGVELVDSPGLNDPTSYGLVTNEYLHKVHAIIYLMNGLNAGKRTDYDEIEELRKREFKTPIFVITRYDNIVEDAENDYNPQEYIREYREDITSQLKKHTELYRQEYQEKLGGNGIFFVSSKQAKDAKKRVPMDMELYINSGYAQFEKYLSDYLVKCKGEERMKTIQSKFNVIANDCINMMKEQLRAADTPLEEFNEKIKDVQNKLQYVNKQSELFVQQFNNELDSIIVNELMPLVPSLLSSAREQCSSWGNGFESSVDYSMLHPKRSAQAIATECRAHFERCYQAHQRQWIKETLGPKIEEGIKKVAQHLEKRSKVIDTTLKDIKLTLNFVSDADSDTSSTAAKVTSVIYGLLTFDVFGASEGFNSGFEGLIKGIITNILINIALICVIGTASIPVVIVGEIINFFIVGHNQKNTVHKKIAKKFTDSYVEILGSSETLESVRNQLKKSIETQFNEFKKIAKDAAFSDIQLVEEEIKQLSDEKNKGEQAVKEHKERLNANISAVSELINNVNEIHKTIA